MGPRDGLDAVAKRRNPFLAHAENPTPGCPSHSLATILSYPDSHLL